MWGLGKCRCQQIWRPGRETWVTKSCGQVRQLWKPLQRIQTHSPNQTAKLQWSQQWAYPLLKLSVTLAQTKQMSPLYSKPGKVSFLSAAYKVLERKLGRKIPQYRSIHATKIQGIAYSLIHLVHNLSAASSASPSADDLRELGGDDNIRLTTYCKLRRYAILIMCIPTAMLPIDAHEYSIKAPTNHCFLTAI